MKRIKRHKWVVSGKKEPVSLSKECFKSITALLAVMLILCYFHFAKAAFYEHYYTAAKSFFLKA